MVAGGRSDSGDGPAGRYPASRPRVSLGEEEPRPTDSVNNAPPPPSRPQDLENGLELISGVERKRQPPLHPIAETATKDKNKITTQEPKDMDGHWTTVSNSKKKPRWKHAPELFPSLNSHKLDKFYVIKSNNSKLLTDDRRAVFKELKSAGVARDDITELRDGSLLIKSKSQHMSQKLSHLSSIGGIDISANPHPKLNRSQGTIFSPKLFHLSEKELLEEFSDFGVTSVYRMKDRVNGSLRPSCRILLTFDSLELPERVYFTWLPFQVRRYFPQPRRCFNCQSYGHIGAKCSHPSKCFYCGQPSHPEEQGRCPNSPKCANCSGPHPASSRSCIHHKFEAEVIALNILSKVSFQEARKQAAQLKSPLGNTYADALRSNFIREFPSPQNRNEATPQTYEQNPQANQAATKRMPEASQKVPKLDPINQETLSPKVSKPTCSSPKERRNTKRNLSSSDDSQIEPASQQEPKSTRQRRKITVPSQNTQSFQSSPIVEVHRENSASQYLTLPSSFHEAAKISDQNISVELPKSFSFESIEGYSSASISSLEGAEVPHPIIKEKDAFDQIERAVAEAVGELSHLDQVSYPEKGNPNQDDSHLAKETPPDIRASDEGNQHTTPPLNSEKEKISTVDPEPPRPIPSIVNPR